MLSGGTTTYYHQDNLSVRLTTDANGNVLTQQATFPFGEQWYQSGSGNKFVFTSYDRDSESGLDYAMARYYYSSTGTFIMADPVAGTPIDPQSWNRYPYARNNPINITDPSGKSWWEKLLVGIGVAVASALFTPVIDGWWAGVLAAEGAGSAAGTASPHAVGDSTPGNTNSPGPFSGDSTSSSVYSFTGPLSYNAGNPYSNTSSTPMFTVTLLYNSGGTNSAQNGMDMFSAAPSNATPWYHSCTAQAIFDGAGTTLLDAIGILPEGGTISAAFSAWHGAAGVSNGIKIQQRASFAAGIVSTAAATHDLQGPQESTLSTTITSLQAAAGGFGIAKGLIEDIPVAGQAIAIGSTALDLVSIGVKVAKCP